MLRVEVEIPRYGVALRVGDRRRSLLIETAEHAYDVSPCIVEAHGEVHRLARRIAVRVGVVRTARGEDVLGTCREIGAGGAYLVRALHVSTRRTAVTAVEAHVRADALI